MSGFEGLKRENGTPVGKIEGAMGMTFFLLSIPASESSSLG